MNNNTSYLNVLQEELAILSSKALKRLKQKTQVLNNFDSNIQATERLTHSMEVGITARIILAVLQEKYNGMLPVNATQLNNVCLLHDIGHPPMGHEFETIVFKILKDEGIFFEGNANNLMVIEKEKIELSDLTKVSLIKYPKKIGKTQKKGLYESQYDKYIPKLLKEFLIQQKKLIANGLIKNNNMIDLINEIDLENDDYLKDLDLSELVRKYKVRMLETVLMEEADDITYLTHDFKDYILYYQKTKDEVNVSRYDKYKDNDYINKLLTINKNDVEKYIIEIRNDMINDLELDLEKNKIKYKSKKLKELKKFLSEFTMTHYITQSHVDIHNIVDMEKYVLYMLSKVDDDIFLKEHMYSETYLNKILESNDIKERKVLMIYAIAEKTDNWLIDDYEKLKRFF